MVTNVQALNKDEFEKRLEEALILGRRGSIARIPPCVPTLLTIGHQKNSQSEYRN